MIGDSGAYGNFSIIVALHSTKNVSTQTTWKKMWEFRKKIADPKLLSEYLVYLLFIILWAHGTFI